jgi:hypothetical protein
VISYVKVMIALERATWTSKNAPRAKFAERPTRDIHYTHLLRSQAMYACNRESADTIQGGGGGDTVFGGPGRDNPQVYGDDYKGSQDEVFCGDGDDQVFADPNDIVDSDCEEVRIVT